ncbi:MAG: MerR family transcriptional regulator [Anaerolineae bacterium]|nr:MerR family transcriptional regulator [Anaerolineae bacterium]
METGLTVQQAAQKTGLSAHTIRYYERIGLIPTIQRAANGHRRYTEDDIGWIEFLKCLRSTGMPIAEMQRYVELQQAGDATLNDRLALLEAHRRRIKAKIRELNNFLERIEGKIDYYQQMKNRLQLRD